MTDEVPSLEPPLSRPKAIKAAAVSLLRGILHLFLILLLLIVLVLVVEPLGFVLELPLRLVFGWALHLWRTLPEVRWSSEMLVSGFLAVALAAVSLHWMARWLCSRLFSGKEQWSWRGTLAVTMIVMVLFCSAMSGTGVVHQAAWLMRTEWIVDDFYSKPLGRDLNRARQLAMAAVIHANEHNGQLAQRLEDVDEDIFDPGELAKLLVPAVKGDEIPEPWIYLGGELPPHSPGWLPLLVQPRPHQTKHGLVRTVITLNNGSEILDDKAYQALLSRRRGYLQNQPIMKP
jgi:hypothetical protein